MPKKRSKVNLGKHSHHKGVYIPETPPEAWQKTIRDSSTPLLFKEKYIILVDYDNDTPRRKIAYELLLRFKM